MPKGQRPYIPNKRRIESALRLATRDDVGGAIKRGDRASMREAQDYESIVAPRAGQSGMRAGYQKGGKVKYADGGMVRGCKGVQTSGKGFRGDY